MKANSVLLLVSGLLVIAGLAGCSLALDTEECSSDQECVELMGQQGATCVSNVCQPGTTTDTQDQDGDDAISEVEDADTLDEMDSADLDDQEEVDDSVDAPDEVGPQTIVVEDHISESTTWESQNTYILEKPIFVVDDSVLTIEAGTQILGDGGALIVTRGAQLRADGTKEEPIVFTSGTDTPTTGDWGGVALMGSAQTNDDDGEGTLEGVDVPAGGEDYWIRYGRRGQLRR